MTEPTTARPGIDPIFKMLLDAVPMTFCAADGVEVARASLAALKFPPEVLPDLRTEDRTIGYGELTDIPVRIYWPPTAQQDDLPVVVYYHGGGWSLGNLDTHDPRRPRPRRRRGRHRGVRRLPAGPGESLAGRRRRQLGGPALGRRACRRTGW